MQIKQFALKYEVPVDTVRFYEKEGLLKPKRLENGYRQYNEDCANQLKMIIVLKQLGFTLKEIYQLTELKMEQITPECNQASVLLFDQKLQQLAEKIEFYKQAAQILETVKQLTHEEKYFENKLVIENLITNLFDHSHLGDL
ncbi:MarR family transcriptional regulator [Lysinibacillus sp. 2017]|uniref:MerR family transcriptional regulator n=1 Tax=unclassified Lysinibacillus TaxID=2636778 RepID=UPI000D52744E|nr:MULTISPECIES: MerR family transcriptional regulator [unclassified Lysinibacillus]AWE07160.1 MarR family transcriptional regulator [Lysinibacillus sp. 2017]TGN36920.1 MerR family transcriptional regulator [Lysinibacillus sp. S2017]